MTRFEAELEFVYFRQKCRGRPVPFKVVEIAIFMSRLISQNAYGRRWKYSTSTKTLQLQLKRGVHIIISDLTTNLSLFKQLSLIPKCKIK